MSVHDMKGFPRPQSMSRAGDHAEKSFPASHFREVGELEGRMFQPSGLVACVVIIERGRGEQNVIVRGEERGMPLVPSVTKSSIYPDVLRETWDYFPASG